MDFSSRLLSWKKACYTAALLVLPVLIVGCDTSGSEVSTLERNFDFNTSPHGWEAFFTNYPAEWRDKMELTSGHRPLPDSSELSGSGLFTSAVNASDDVKMLFRRQVKGLQPNATYRARFTVRFATSAPSGCPGVGGSPGEAVKVIAAASTVRPEPFIDEEPEDYYRLNIQHQNDPQEWHENTILGHIGNSQGCKEESAFEMKELKSNETHDVVTADENGKAWLLFGTRSGFEGKTSIFFTRFQAKLHR